MTNFYLASFITALALNAVVLATPLFLIARFNVSPIFLGLLGTFGAIFYTVFVVIAGRLADKFEKKVLISLGCLSFSIIYLIVPHLKNAYHVLLMVPLGSMSLAFFWPSVQSWIAHGLDKKTLTKVLGVFNISWSLGLTFGPFVGGFLFERALWLPFVFGSFAIILVVLILSRQPTIKQLKKIKDEGNNETEIEHHEKKIIVKFLYIGWVANFSSWFCMGIIRFLFPKLTTTLGITPSQLGVIMLGLGLSQMFVFIFLGRTHRWHYKLTPVIISQLLAFIGLGMVVLSSTKTFLAVAIFILGICFGVTYYSSIFYSLWGHIDKGKKSGLHEGIIGMGSLVGPFLGGIAAQIFNLRAPYILSIGAILIAIIAEIWILKKN